MSRLRTVMLRDRAGGAESARGSKTPRSTSRAGGSPNSRARKSARSQLQPPLSPGRPLEVRATFPLSGASAWRYLVFVHFTAFCAGWS